MDAFLSEPFIDFVSVMPFEVLMTYLYTKLLSMRRVGWFWAVRLGVSVFLVLVRSSLGPVVRTSLGIVTYFVVPFLFSEGKATRRLFVLLMTYILIMVAEFSSAGLWYAATGLPIADYEAVRRHLAQFAALHLFHLLISIALIGGLCALVRRRVQAGSSRDMLVFSGFPAMQVALLTIALMMKVYIAPGNDSMYPGMCGFIAVFLVSDIVLFAEIDRLERKRAADERAAMLARELDAYLDRYGEVMDGVEDVARLRHDLRNQVQVASVLIERGETALAQGHLDRMLERAADTSVGTSA